MKQKIYPSEAQEGYALIQWCCLHPICAHYIFHIANGGSRNRVEAINLKRSGVRAGVSDYFLPYPINGFHGLWIELKRRDKIKSKPTKEQSKWLDSMKKLGYAASIAYGWEEAKEIILKYLHARGV